jgi:thiol:disulfide interchange protein
MARAPWPRMGLGAALASSAAALWLAAGTLPSAGGAVDTVGTVPEGRALRSADSGLSASSYSAEALSAALADGRPVFVNMTAAWCITCLVNERVALSRPAVARAFRERRACCT